ncbi:hypothetical protein Tco_0608750 [Tanacetum coccineum]
MVVWKCLRLMFIDVVESDSLGGLFKISRWKVPKKRPLVALLAPMEGPKPLLAPMESPKQRKYWSGEMIKVMDQYRVGSSASVSAASASGPSASGASGSRASASGASTSRASASRASASGALAIMERV